MEDIGRIYVIRNKETKIRALSAERKGQTLWQKQLRK